MARLTKAEKDQAKAIEVSFYKFGYGIQINIMDLSKITNSVKLAVARGEAMDDAMQQAIEMFRVK